MLRKRNHRIFRLLLAAGAVLAGSPSHMVAQAMKLTGTFSSTKLYAKPGQTLGSGFQLTLDPDYHPTVFRNQISDFYRSEDGSQSSYPPSGTLPHSCGQWVTLNPVEKRVNPGEKLDLRLTVSVPAATQPGGYWCALTVDQVPEPLEENADPNGPGQVQLNFLASISTGIFVYVEPLHRSAQVGAVDISGDVAKIQLINDGNTPLAVEGRFEFFREARFELARESQPAEPIKVPLTRTTLFTEPANRTIIATQLPTADQLPSGSYLVRLILDVGLDHLIGVQKRIDLQREK